MSTRVASSTPEPAADGGRRGSRTFLRRWLTCSLAGGATVSAFDAALLQRRESYFTGGFLSTDHLNGPDEVAAFAVLSLLVDAAVVGAVAALVMWACRGLRPRACALAGFLAGVVPLFAADFVAYELGQYLGDALDIGLMFDLAGGNVAEFLAVSSDHLVAPMLLGIAGVAACGGIVWIVNRRERGAPVGPPRLRTLLVPVLALCVTLVASLSATSMNVRFENGVLRKPAGQALAFVADELTDFDGDGFGLASRMSDPDAWNAQVFPYAVDVPGNGLDENGIAGDLPLDAAPYLEPAVRSAWRRSPDVVLVVLESFRFDLVGGSFEGRPVTPVLDGLAARGLSSSYAYSHNGYTAQSRFHLLSGSLGAVRDGATLIDDFNDHGYHTVWASGQDESFGGPRYDSGFMRADVRFDARSDRERRYSTFTTAGSLAVPFTVVEERATQSLHDAPRDQPFFLYLNFHDTHFPYSHDVVKTLTSETRLPRGRIVPHERDALWATYVNTAANVDRAIGNVLDNVRRIRGTEPAIIVTSDHGESLFDDGFLGHGHALNDVQTRVPLIVSNLPLTIEEPFGHVDLRDAIARAMQVPSALPSLPRTSTDSSRQVFQYLGNVNRPRQIAFYRRVVYDFRSRQAQVGSGPWRQPEELAGPDRAEFLRLVRLWERMMLARRARVVDE